MSTIYDEGQVGFEFQGQTFYAGGAIVDEKHCVGYPGPCDRPSCKLDPVPSHSHTGCCGPLNDCAGKPIGRYEITGTWKTPRSWESSETHSITATVQGRVYHGRGHGVNMLFRGRRNAGGLRKVQKAEQEIRSSWLKK